jgi:5-amino-6-(5-phosphoribosylamino)uracil reductase
MRRLWPDPGAIDDVDALVAAADRPAPPDRPWLLVNMITSLDGAITIDDRSGGLGRPADKVMFAALRAVGDVILAGAGTVRAEHYGPVRPTAATRAARRERGQAEVPRLAIATRRLDLDLTLPLFTEADAPPIVLTCAASPVDRRAAASEVAEVIVTGHETVDLAAAMAELHTRGVRTVTCEGGASLNGDLLLADLIDEWALTLSPLLVGGPADRAVAGPTPSSPREMHLDWLLEGDGLLLTRWLRDR